MVAKKENRNTWRKTFSDVVRSTWRKTFSGVVLSTINLTWAVLGSNPGLPGDREATNSLDVGTAQRQKSP